MPCEGDSSTTCGDVFAFDLFTVPVPAPTPAPTPGPTLYPESLGCYKDTREARVFTNMLTAANMTPLVRMGGRHRDRCMLFSRGTSMVGSSVPSVQYRRCFSAQEYPIVATSHHSSGCQRLATNVAYTLSEIESNRIVLLFLQVCAAHCAEYAFFATQFGKEVRADLNAVTLPPSPSACVPSTCSALGI